MQSGQSKCWIAQCLGKRRISDPVSEFDSWDGLPGPVSHLTTLLRDVEEGYYEVRLSIRRIPKPDSSLRF